MSFNMKDPLLGKNKNLRLAIAHALETDKYIEIFTFNTGQKANSIYPPSIPGYDPSRELPYHYDIKKAKEYLAKAGYPEGKNLPTITYDVRGTNSTAWEQARSIKQQLSLIGINVEIVKNSFPEFLEKAKKGNLQFWQDGWVMDYPDAENILQLLYSKNFSPGPNATYFSNKKFDEYFNQLKFLPDGPKKHELMSKMESIVTEEVPWIMQYYARNYILHHNYVQNFRPSDIINNYLKYIKIDAH
jgi:ABC-type transport system substrate-binding protein